MQRLAGGRAIRRSAQVLHRPGNRKSQIVRDVKRPVGLAQEFASHFDQVRLALAKNRVCLRRVGNHSNCCGEKTRFAFDFGSKRNLISRSDRNLRTRNSSPGGAVNHIHAERTELARKFDGLINVPPLVHPVRRGDAHEERIILRPDPANGSNDFAEKPRAIVERATMPYLCVYWKAAKGIRE